MEALNPNARVRDIAKLISSSLERVFVAPVHDGEGMMTMPKAARLDVLGVVQHVMARGLDGQAIFRDGKDRAAFLERLGTVIEGERGFQ